jgi:hypothetical protein
MSPRETSRANRHKWSIAIYCLTWLILHWGLPGQLLGQFLLLAGIVIVRVWRDRSIGN